MSHDFAHCVAYHFIWLCDVSFTFVLCTILSGPDRTDCCTAACLEYNTHHDLAVPVQNTLGDVYAADNGDPTVQPSSLQRIS